MYQKVTDAFLAQGKDYYEIIDAAIGRAMSDISNETDGFYDIDELNLISGSFGSQLFIKYFANREGIQKKYYNDYHDEDTGYPYDSINHNLPEIQPEWWPEIDYFDYWKKPFTLNFYMLTNQMNLMDGSIENWGGGSTKDSILFHEIDEIRVVAFRNTNDFLCYYVPEHIIKNYFGEYVEISVTNSYYWNLILRNNALQAHTAVFKLNKLAKAITKGSNGTFWVKELPTKDL